MTYTNFNISVPKKDVPMFKKLSKKMGWATDLVEEPNEETIAAIREAESGVDLDTFDFEAFHKMVASL